MRGTSYTFNTNLRSENKLKNPRIYYVLIVFPSVVFISQYH